MVGTRLVVCSNLGVLAVVGRVRPSGRWPALAPCARVAARDLRTYAPLGLTDLLSFNPLFCYVACHVHVPLGPIDLLGLSTLRAALRLRLTDVPRPVP